ncbi:MAG: DUF1622 domain-containing protein [Ignavibacteria bacterium]
MEIHIMHDIIEVIASAIEIIAVIVIAGSILVNLTKALFKLNSKDPEFFKEYKNKIGKALQAGLEFLVAADIIRTVTIEPTLQGVLILGLLVLIRTFLSWSLIVEAEERWPWQSAKNENVTQESKE